ncbi:MAG: hypothetical protein LBO04_06685 [Spirochaetaceae bacterium]|nr:hypothetical protein [Spirochaetaceae bacterium]
MKKFWNIFWKTFAGLIIAALVTSIVAGIVLHSMEITYVAIRGIFAIGLGVCGFIGFVVVPIEMYIEYRLKGGAGTNDEVF